MIEPSPSGLSATKPMLQKPWVPYIAPFALFVLLTALANQWPAVAHLVYIAKTVLTAALLWKWRRVYGDDFSVRIGGAGSVMAVAAGIVALVLWVAPDALLPKLGTPAGFDPYALGWPKSATMVLIAVRLAGSALVVPIMEELFWRSFLLRYAIHPHFKTVALGTFSWFSFCATVVLFGLEHYQVIQGILAGIVYTLLVVRQKSLRGCTLAHGVTNLGLGIYVLTTENWLFW